MRLCAEFDRTGIGDGITYRIGIGRRLGRMYIYRFWKCSWRHGQSHVLLQFLGQMLLGKRKHRGCTVDMALSGSH